MGKLSEVNSALIKAEKIIKEYAKTTSLSKECENVVRAIEMTVNEVNKIRFKERDLSYENRYTAEQLQEFYDQGYAIQRKFKGNFKGWGTLRNRPTFEDDELARYSYRVMKVKEASFKKVYEEVGL